MDQTTTQPPPWWQTAIFYQIYPRSFADTNGDGIGDIPGIIRHLDYLQDLGINGIWLSPHYPSPNHDCGYDISNYTEVAPEYGTLADFEQFLNAAHNRGIRVILDMVLNHTSDQHPWFIESRSSRANPKRDWYIWREKTNNWNSCFDGRAWEFDAATKEYYYHYFFKQQPDLNWRNPKVKQAMWEAVRFWLDLGVDGYRLDAIGTIFERPDFHEHRAPYTLAELRKAMHEAATPRERAMLGKQWRMMFHNQVNQPGMHELMQELRQVVQPYKNAMLIAEDSNPAYHGDGDNELHMVFNFPLMQTDRLTPAWVRANQQKRLAKLAQISPQAWPCNTLGNHDCSRVYTRFGDGDHNDALARLHLVLLLTLRGTPFLYNGEEIGMSDLLLGDITQFRDTLGKWLYEADIQSLGYSPAKALEHAARETRDKGRTPMQWRNAPNAGFCPPGKQPWLPVNPNYAAGVNVAEQDADPASMLNFYRRIIHLRRSSVALQSGEFIQLRPRSLDYLAYLRQSSEQTCLVLMNFTSRSLQLAFDEWKQPAKVLFAIADTPRSLDLRDIHLSPYGALILEIND